MSEQQDNKTFEADGTRPIESGDIEVADTFEEDGTRPIAQSPDFLITDSSDKEERSANTDRSNADKVIEVDGQRPVDSSDIEVVDTFEEDGTRPIARGRDFLVADSKGKQGDRPIGADRSNADKVIEVDGQRPVDNSETEVVDTFEADGTRPVMTNKYNVVDTLDVDGERPITSK